MGNCEPVDYAKADRSMLGGLFYHKGTKERMAIVFLLRSSCSLCLGGEGLLASFRRLDPPAENPPTESLAGNAYEGELKPPQQIFPFLPPGPWPTGLTPIQRSSTGSEAR
jgi:hypothetical protein